MVKQGITAAPPAIGSPTSSSSLGKVNRRKRVPPYAKRPESVCGSSGYAGDMEGATQSLLPLSIELASRQKKRYAVVDVKPLYPDGKRPKPSKEELNYLACNAQEEMEKGKKMNNSSQQRRPRIFSSQKVDMSLVELVPARTYDAGRSGSSSGGTVGRQEAVLYQLFEQVAKDVAHAYRAVKGNDDLLKEFTAGVEKAHAFNGKKDYQNQQSSQQSSSGFNSDTSGSATSSFTDSDGDYFERTSTKQKSLDGPGNSEPTHEITSSDGSESGLLSLGKALGFSEKPKIVVLSTAPHLIIHANAAFQCMVGGPMNVVGKATSHVFHDLAAVMNTVVTQGKKATHVVHDDKKMSVAVYPVGSSVDQVTTHVVLEVVESGKTTAAASDAESVAMMG